MLRNLTKMFFFSRFKLTGHSPLREVSQMMRGIVQDSARLAGVYAYAPARTVSERSVILSFQEVPND